MSSQQQQRKQTSSVGKESDEVPIPMSDLQEIPQQDATMINNPSPSVESSPFTAEQEEVAKDPSSSPTTTRLAFPPSTPVDEITAAWRGASLVPQDDNQEEQQQEEPTEPAAAIAGVPLCLEAPLGEIRTPQREESMDEASGTSPISGHGGAADSKPISPASIAPKPRDDRVHRVESQRRTLSQYQLDEWKFFAEKRAVSPPHKIRLSLRTVERRANDLLRIAAAAEEKYGREQLTWNTLYGKEQAMLAFALNQGFDSLFPHDGTPADRNRWVRVLIRSICDHKHITHLCLYNLIRKEGDMPDRTRSARDIFDAFLRANPAWQEEGAFLIYREHPYLRIFVRFQEPYSTICVFESLALAMYISACIRKQSRVGSPDYIHERNSDTMLNVSRFMRQGLPLKDQFQNIFCATGGFTLESAVNWLFQAQGKRFHRLVNSYDIRSEEPQRVYNWVLDRLRYGPIFHDPLRLPRDWLLNETLVSPTEFDDTNFRHFCVIIGVRLVETPQGQQVLLVVQDSLDKYPFREVSLQVLLDGEVEFLYAFSRNVEFPSAAELPMTKPDTASVLWAGASPKSPQFFAQHHGEQTDQDNQPELSEWKRQQVMHWFADDDHVLGYDPSLIDNENPTLEVDVPPCPLLPNEASEDDLGLTLEGYDGSTMPSSYDEDDGTDSTEDYNSD